jgi:hypothetical protein
MKMAGTKWTRRLTGVGAVLVLAAAVSLGVVALDRDGDGADGDDRGRLVRPRGNSSLAEARAFDGYPLYFAGGSALGHRLEAVLRLDRTSPARYVEFTFLYGACRARGDQGCGAPLVILLWPACYRYETRSRSVRANGRSFEASPGDTPASRTGWSSTPPRRRSWFRVRR